VSDKTLDEKALLMAGVLDRVPDTQKMFVVYRFRGEKLRVTAERKTETFDPAQLGHATLSPIKRRDSRFARNLCKRNTALAELNEEIGLALLRKAIEKSEKGSANPVSDAWEEMFHDKIPALAAHASENKQRAALRRELRKKFGVVVTDEEYSNMTLGFLQEVKQTKGQAYWAWKMKMAADEELPEPQRAMAQVSDPAKLRKTLIAVAADKGITLEVGTDEGQIHPALKGPKLLAMIAEHNEDAAREMGWDG
jgi:hypothetical protein